MYRRTMVVDFKGKYHKVSIPCDIKTKETEILYKAMDILNTAEKDKLERLRFIEQGIIIPIENKGFRNV